MEQILNIKEEQLRELRSALNTRNAGEFSIPFGVIAAFSATFEDGTRARIEVINDTCPTIHSSLFDKSGKLILKNQENHRDILGVYHFEYGFIYQVVIEQG